MVFRNTVLSGLLAVAGFFPAESYAVPRDNVAFSVNYGSLSIGSEQYESGVSVGVYGNVNIPLAGKISLNPKLDASYFSYGVVGKNATEELMALDLSLDGRVALGPKAYVSLGGEYFLDDELMLYGDFRGHVRKRSLGPRFVFGVESDSCDFSVSLSELFGHKSTSFDKKRMIRTEHLNITVIPRSKQVELRAMLDFFHSAIADILADRDEFLLKFTFQPGISISENFSVFPHVSYIFGLFGYDVYSSGEAGLGARVRW